MDTHSITSECQYTRERLTCIHFIVDSWMLRDEFSTVIMSDLLIL